jgi:hypothetical protein
MTETPKVAKISRDNVFSALTEWAHRMKLIPEDEEIFYLTVSDSKHDGLYNLHIRKHP